MEKCRRRDLDSDPQSEEGTTGDGVGARGIGHWHVCRFMQHFSNYIRVGRHYNGNYTQEPQNMPVGGWMVTEFVGGVPLRPALWHSGIPAYWHFGIPPFLSSSRGAATWSSDARLWRTTVAAAEGPVIARLAKCLTAWMAGWMGHRPVDWLGWQDMECRTKIFQLNNWSDDTEQFLSHREQFTSVKNKLKSLECVLSLCRTFLYSIMFPRTDNYKCIEKEDI